MFDYIKGTLVSKTQNKATYFTVEAGNIGYFIEVHASDYLKKNVNDEVKVYTVLIHREDTMALCGFLSKEARDIFNIMTAISGVGLKMALTMLSQFEVSDLIYFVINENHEELTKAKGIGSKFAQKIILELKDKLINLQRTMDIPVKSDLPEGCEEVQNILLSLGYEEDEVSNAIKQACATGKMSGEKEEILRSLLQILSA